MISSLIYDDVDPNGRNTSHAPSDKFAAIRPLGQSCGGKNDGGEFMRAFPSDLRQCLNSLSMPVKVMPNERALLSWFLLRISNEDPDLVVSHNMYSMDLDLLLGRSVKNRLGEEKRVKLSHLLQVLGRRLEGYVAQRRP